MEVPNDTLKLINFLQIKIPTKIKIVNYENISGKAKATRKAALIAQNKILIDFLILKSSVSD
jgi:hypothetical protein